MKCRHALSLALSLLILAPLQALQGAAPQEAIGAFLRAAAGRDDAERQAALEALVATGHEAAVEPLAQEFARTSTRLREARDELFRQRYVRDQRRRLLADLELGAQRDPSLERALTAERERLAKLEAELERRERDLAALEPWYRSLGQASPRLFAALNAASRRKVEGLLWRDANSSADLAARLGAVELLGMVGSPGTAAEAAKLIEALSKERVLMRRAMSRDRAAIKALEARMQKESEQLEGRLSNATHEQYERAKREAAQKQRELTLSAFVLDAAALAGGRALAREEGRDLERSLAGLLRTQRQAKDGARLRLLDLLGHAASEPVRAALRELLAGEKDAAARAELIDALAAGGDRGIVPDLLETWIVDPSWHVRSRAAHALARLRERDAVPVLIDRMAVEQGRVRTDLEAALRSLTGRYFHGNLELWRRWWGEHRETFEVPEPTAFEPQASEAAREGLGTDFFGIRTTSDRVLFVLDLSGSMKWSMIPRNNPEDDPGRSPDMPREGELSRLQAAQRELIRALNGIPDGGIFNVVLYASDVWTWQDRPVAMRDDTRAAAVRFVEGLDALGGTNIYGALELALDLAGAKAGDTWDAPTIDTIYFLSDGRPSVGVTTAPDEILAYVRDRNRSAGIVIHSIGLSGAQDPYLMRNLAEQNGGIYVSR